MEKSSKNQIETDENKLLTELMKNAKENLDIIAKNCGFSRQKVWRMMKQLDKDQKIWGYSAVVDSDKQNLKKFMLFFKRTNEPIDSKEKNKIAVTRLDSLKEELGITVLHSYHTHGMFDWVTIFTAKDILQAKRFVNALTKNYSHAQSSSMSQILFTVRENTVENPKIKELENFL